MPKGSQRRHGQIMLARAGMIDGTEGNVMRIGKPVARMQEAGKANNVVGGCVPDEITVADKQSKGPRSINRRCRCFQMLRSLYDAVFEWHGRQY